jgi:hypothetical protein
MERRVLYRVPRRFRDGKGTLRNQFCQAAVFPDKIPL